MLPSHLLHRKPKGLPRTHIGPNHLSHSRPPTQKHPSTPGRQTREGRHSVHPLRSQLFGTSLAAAAPTDLTYKHAGANIYKEPSHQYWCCWIVSHHKGSPVKVTLTSDHAPNTKRLITSMPYVWHACTRAPVDTYCIQTGTYTAYSTQRRALCRQKHYRLPLPCLETSYRQQGEDRAKQTFALGRTQATTHVRTLGQCSPSARKPVHADTIWRCAGQAWAYVCTGVQGPQCRW